jgi:hypothetical protein
MPAKKTLRGGQDPREMARKSHEARAANKARKAQAVHEKYRELPLDELPAAVLREIVSDVKTPQAVRVQAARTLADIPVEDDDGGWRASVQVRPDYKSPSWDEVLEVAREAGATI